MRLFKIRILFNLFISLSVSCMAYSQCHPQVNMDMPQHVVGYGSLMFEPSKQQSYPFHGKNIPIILSGYKRAWMIHGYLKSQATTFLGITEDRVDTKINAVVFKLDNQRQIDRLDKREVGYCRKLVNPKNIQILDNKSKIDGQYWVYLSKEDIIFPPTSKFPISEYYVDIFIAGCLDIERQFKILGFAKQCISSTSLWTYEFDQHLPKELTPLNFDRKSAHDFLINNL